MIRGLYTAASGMVVEMVRNDVTTNNLANVNTTGYKKDTALFKSFPEHLIHRIHDYKKTDVQKPPVIGSLGTGAIVDEVVTAHEQGQIKETTNPFDLAILGEGYFVVENPNGTFYTRNGSFTLDSQGYLVTSTGDYLMGQNGRIRISNPKDVRVDETGNIFAKEPQVDEAGNSVEVDRRIDALRLVSVADKAGLTKIGDSLFAGGQAVNGIEGQIKQRFIESSNVNVIQEMVNMITIMRAYEANQKVVTAHDQTLAQAIEIGANR